MTLSTPHLDQEPKSGLPMLPASDPAIAVFLEVAPSFLPLLGGAAKGITTQIRWEGNTVRSRKQCLLRWLQSYIAGTGF